MQMMPTKIWAMPKVQMRTILHLENKLIFVILHQKINKIDTKLKLVFYVALAPWTRILDSDPGLGSRTRVLGMDHKTVTF